MAELFIPGKGRGSSINETLKTLLQLKAFEQSQTESRLLEREVEVREAAEERRADEFAFEKVEAKAKASRLEDEQARLEEERKLRARGLEIKTLTDQRDQTRPGSGLRNEANLALLKLLGEVGGVPEELRSGLVQAVANSGNLEEFDKDMAHAVKMGQKCVEEQRAGKKSTADCEKEMSGLIGNLFTSARNIAGVAPGEAGELTAPIETLQQELAEARRVGTERFDDEARAKRTGKLAGLYSRLQSREDAFRKVLERDPSETVDLPELTRRVRGLNEAIKKGLRPRGERQGKGRQRRLDTPTADAIAMAMRAFVDGAVGERTGDPQVLQEALGVAVGNALAQLQDEGILTETPQGGFEFTNRADVSEFVTALKDEFPDEDELLSDTLKQYLQGGR